MPAPSLPTAPFMEQSMNQATNQFVHRINQFCNRYDQNDDQTMKQPMNQSIRPVFKPFYPSSSSLFINPSINQPTSQLFKPQVTVIHNQSHNQSMNQSMDQSPMYISPIQQSICSTASTMSNFSDSQTISRSQSFTHSFNQYAVQSTSMNQSMNQSNKSSNKRPQHFTFSLDDIDQAFVDTDLEEWFDMDGSVRQLSNESTMDDKDKIIATSCVPSDSPVVVVKPNLSIFTGYNDETVSRTMNQPSNRSQKRRPEHFTFSPHALTQSLNTVSQTLQLGHWSTFPLCIAPVCNVTQLRGHLQSKRVIELTINMLSVQPTKHVDMDKKFDDIGVNKFVHSKVAYQSNSQSNNQTKNQAAAHSLHQSIKQAQVVWSRDQSLKQSNKRSINPSTQMQPQHRLVRSVSAVPPYRTINPAKQSSYQSINSMNPYQLRNQPINRSFSYGGEVKQSMSDPSSMVSTPSRSNNQSNGINSQSFKPPMVERKRHHSQTFKQSNNQSISQSINFAAAQYAAQQAASDMSLFQHWQALQHHNNQSNNQSNNQFSQFNQSIKSFDQFINNQSINQSVRPSNFQDAWMNTHNQNNQNNLSIKQSSPFQSSWSYQSINQSIDSSPWCLPTQVQLPMAQPHYTKQQPRVLSAPFH